MVDHGSCLPATRMEATTVLPSGAQAKSSLPPNGLDGASPSRVALIAEAPFTGAALAAGSGATNRVLRRPSFQVSQWRTNNWSNTSPVFLRALCASSFLLVQARSEPQAWNTPLLKATRSPCGETWKLSTSTGKSVSWRGVPPVVGCA
ncbi:hypothetical protein D3C71_1561570 [compost metagenome]